MWICVVILLEVRGERAQNKRWMDKVKKAKGVNHKLWNAYKSLFIHAGVSLKVPEIHISTHTQLLLNYSRDSFPASCVHHNEGDNVIY